MSHSLVTHPILDAVVNTIVDCAIVIDRHGIIQSVNAPCLRIFGYSREAIIGSNISQLMPEPNRSAHDDYLRNYERTGEAQIIGIGRDVEGLRANDEIFPLNLAVGEMQVGEQTLFLGIIRDLSDQKARQAAFEELQSRHFHLSRVAAMNEMGTAIAHEINQPLTAASNYLETARILIGRLDGHTSQMDRDRINDMLARSVEQNKRASQIITRMRRFIEKRDVQLTDFELAPVIDEALILGLTNHIASQPEVTVEITNGAGWVAGDPVQVQQVLVNLIRNAADAMVEREIRELNLLVRPDPDDVGFIRVEVHDTGMGVSQEASAQLFKAFVTSKTDGMGVGLSISQSIIKTMGGRIWASPRPTGGMKFAFTLPLASAT